MGLFGFSFPMEKEHVMSQQSRQAMQQMFLQAIGAVDPRALIRRQITSVTSSLSGAQTIHFGSLEVDPDQVDRIFVIGAGKASAGMAAAIEQRLAELGKAGQRLLSKLSGIVNVPDGIVSTCKKIHITNVRPQGSNAPTPQVLVATQGQLDLIGRLGPRDILIDLISGGGSATRELPCKGLTLDDLEEVRLAMKSATIQELNAVRKYCSLVKGGGMNRLTRAGNVLVWVLSDVVGDPLDFIASGPWAQNTSSPSAALGILQKYSVTSGAVYEHILGLTKLLWHPIAPGQHVRQEIIGNNAIALAELQAALSEGGRVVISHGSGNVGDARQVGTGLLSLGDLECAAEISGGETTVALKKDRNPQFKGGRNQTIVLAALLAAWERGLGNKVVFSIGTDGEDGPTDAAGAIVDQEILENAKAMGITREEVEQALDNGDEYQLLKRMGALIITGPTGTNVCDLWGVVTCA